MGPEFGDYDTRKKYLEERALTAFSKMLADVKGGFGLALSSRIGAPVIERYPTYADKTKIKRIEDIPDIGDKYAATYEFTIDQNMISTTDGAGIIGLAVTAEDLVKIMKYADNSISYGREVNRRNFFLNRGIDCLTSQFETELKIHRDTNNNRRFDENPKYHEMSAEELGKYFRACAFSKGNYIEMHEQSHFILQRDGEILSVTTPARIISRNGIQPPRDRLVHPTLFLYVNPNNPM